MGELGDDGLVGLAVAWGDAPDTGVGDAVALGVSAGVPVTPTTGWEESLAPVDGELPVGWPAAGDGDESPATAPEAAGIAVLAEAEGWVWLPVAAPGTDRVGMLPVSEPVPVPVPASEPAPWSKR